VTASNDSVTIKISKDSQGNNKIGIDHNSVFTLTREAGEYASKTMT